MLRYGWTGWPKQGTKFTSTPGDVLTSAEPLWEQGGLRLMESRWTTEMIQLTFSTTTEVSPVFLAARAKGRLDYSLRTYGYRMPLSRKVAVRSIGKNTRKEVEEYIANQVGKEQYYSEEYTRMLEELTTKHPEVDLEKPAKSSHGRYWYCLHLVLVVAGRCQLKLEQLQTIRSTCYKIAEKKDYAISTLAVMPEHLHAALRGNIEQSPVDIVYAFQNNLTYHLRQPVWQDTFYIGTRGEYNMNAVRLSCKASRDDVKGEMG